MKVIGRMENRRRGRALTGLAVDAAGHRLYSGCHNQVMAVVDTDTGKTLATLPIGKGVDACEFDPITGNAFASCGDGTLTIARKTSRGQFEVTPDREHSARPRRQDDVHAGPGDRTCSISRPRNLPPPRHRACQKGRPRSLFQRPGRS